MFFNISALPFLLYFKSSSKSLFKPAAHYTTPTVITKQLDNKTNAFLNIDISLNQSFEESICKSGNKMNDSFYADLFGNSDEEGESEQFDRAIESTLISAANASILPTPILPAPILPTPILPTPILPTPMLSPLPPDTPCHGSMSQYPCPEYQYGGHSKGTAPSSTIPFSLASLSNEYSWEKEESDFTRWPKDDAVVSHLFEATENLRGLQTIVALKLSRSSFLDESGIFPQYNPTIAKLESYRPTAKNGTYAFLQVTTRGHGFRKHDNAPSNSTLTVTTKSYLALLHFFDKEWKRVSSKMKSELQSMQESSCGVNICKGLSFYGSGVSRYRKLLESFGDFALFVIVSVDSTVTCKGEKIFVQLKYNKHPDSPMPDSEVKSLGEIELPIEALIFLSGSREQLYCAINNLGRSDFFLNRQTNDNNKNNVVGSDNADPILLPSVASNESFAELASQIRHPVPEVELKMQSAAAKILEYASGGGSNSNQLSTDEIRRIQTEATKLAPPFFNKKTVSDHHKQPGNKIQPNKTASVLSTQTSLNQLLNRGLCNVTGERGYFTVEGNVKQGEKVKKVSTAQPRKRGSRKDENGDFKIPKNKKQCV